LEILQKGINLSVHGNVKSQHRMMHLNSGIGFLLFC